MVGQLGVLSLAWTEPCLFILRDGKMRGKMFPQNAGGSSGLVVWDQPVILEILVKS